MQTNIEAYKHIYRKTKAQDKTEIQNTLTKKQAHTHTGTNRQTDCNICINTYIQTPIQGNIHTDRHAYRKTNIHTYTYT